MAAMLICIGAFAKSEKDSQVTFKITPGMTCGNCEQKIKSNLRFEKGVTAIEASAPGDVVTVKYNPSKTTESKLIAAFSKLGYQASVYDAESAGKSTKEVKVINVPASCDTGSEVPTPGECKNAAKKCEGNGKCCGQKNQAQGACCGEKNKEKGACCGEKGPKKAVLNCNPTQETAAPINSK